ncbi:MAG: response regulator [Bryobacteraceae bacterium]|nr:response regulator [Solibacteraceae bacterium]MCL4841797.1 response regulator [Bryobacteraceae bacterium]MCO5352965.1 response regulator [Bryobacteraceae bacterium]
MAPARYIVHLAEDSAPLRELLASQLDQLPGVQVAAAAASAAGTLANLGQGLPDLLVVDLQLDRSSALDVLRDLTREEGRPRVVILTNHAGREARDACRAAGADAFFDKSTEFGLFLEAVRRWAAEAGSGFV